MESRFSNYVNAWLWQLDCDRLPVEEVTSDVLEEVLLFYEWELIDYMNGR